MGSISVPIEEYKSLKRCEAIIKVVEAAIHGDDWNNLLTLSSDVAKELWDNKYDEVWNNV